MKGNDKLCHTMFSIHRKTAAVSCEKFKKIKNLKKTREFFWNRDKRHFLSPVKGGENVFCVQGDSSELSETNWP